MINFEDLTCELNPQKPENKCVVRLKTSTWSDKRGVYLKKSITYLRRLSRGYLILEEDTKNIGTDDDLFIENGRVIVCGKGDNGELIELGCVRLSVGYQKGVDARMLIDKVKFG